MNVQDAKGNLSRLLAAAERGEQVIISRNNNPVVELAPIARAGQRELGFIPGVVSDAILEPMPESEMRFW